VIRYFALILVFSATAYASGFDCSDSSGQIQYSSSHSDGGPCCGRSGTTLSYQGQVVKSVEWIGGLGGNDQTTDSTPDLKLTEGTRVDLHNNSVDGYFNISSFAVNITLSSVDGRQILPWLKLPALVSLVCTERDYAGPPIP